MSSFREGWASRLSQAAAALGAQDHGGDGAYVTKLLGLDPDDYIDLSAPLNPFDVVPQEVLRSGLDELRSYPDPSARSEARLVAELIGVDPECVAVGNGSTELLSATIAFLGKYRGSRRLVAGHPPFGEVRRAAKREGLELVEVPWGPPLGDWGAARARRALEELGVGIFTRPTTPAGALPPLEVVEGLEVSAGQGLTVWDEAYYALATGRWISERAQRAVEGGAMVVSSLTKITGLPGLRFGFLVSAPRVIEEIERLLPAWRISPLAGAVLRYLLERGDPGEWASLCRELRSEFEASIGEAGYLRPVGGEAPYVLCEVHPRLGDAPTMRAAAALCGIGVRDCSSFGDRWRRFVRVGLPKPERFHEAVRRLAMACEALEAAGPYLPNEAARSHDDGHREDGRGDTAAPRYTALEGTFGIG